MGWLRELMATASPALASYGELSRRVLEHGEWPEDVRPQARSLAAIFSKLDRGIDVEWLADRPWAQQALAGVLGVPTEEVRAAVEPASRAGTGWAGPIRLEDLRYGRSLQLNEQDLFPGIPPQALDPAQWSRTFWHAPGGAGRTLVGRLLASRGQATFVAAASWAQAVASLPRQGAAFVELPYLRDHDLRPCAVDCPSALRLCVAAPFEAPAEGWEIVDSPPVDQFLDDLLAWVGARLSEERPFDPHGLAQWLRTNGMLAGALDTAGGVIGLCGALDELGIGPLGSLGVEDLARRFMSQQVLTAAERGGTDAAWLGRSGYEVMLGLVRRLLTETMDPWEASRPMQSWLALVPPEYQHEADVEWLQLSLGNEGGRIRSSDIQRAARLLPPGAFRIVRGLRAANLLVPGDEPNTLRLRPRWLGRWLVGRVESSIAQGTAIELGEALLNPLIATSLASRLLERLLAEDTSPIVDVLELEAEENPAQVMAMETVFRCAGLALLEGAELPPDELAALQDEQLGMTVRFPGAPPAPRFLHPDVPAGHILGHSLWLLAALSISEQLPQSGSSDALRPWAARKVPQGLLPVLDGISTGLPSMSTRWALGAFLLVGRLRDALGDLAEGMHPLEQPARIIEEASHEVLRWATVRGLSRVAHAVPCLPAVAKKRGASWETAARALWHAWVEDGCDPEGVEIFAGAAACDLLPYLPPQLEAAAFSCLWEKLDPSLLGTSQLKGFAAFCQSRAEGPEKRLLSCVTSHQAGNLFASFAPQTGEGARLAWRRFPEETAAVLDRLLSASWPPGTYPLLAEVPAERVSRLITRLEELDLDAAREADLLMLRRWLHQVVARRTGGFAEAYRLLAVLERDLAHVESARGH